MRLFLFLMVLGLICAAWLYSTRDSNHVPSAQSANGGQTAVPSGTLKSRQSSRTDAEAVAETNKKRPDAKGQLAVLDTTLAMLASEKPRNWSGNHRWLDDSLGRLAVGAGGLVTWLVMHTEAELILRQLATALLTRAVNRRNSAQELQAARAQAVEYLDGTLPLPGARAWLSAAALAGPSAPPQRLGAVEETGLSFLPAPPAVSMRVLQALVDLGVNSSVVHDELVRVMRSILASDSSASLDGWKPGESMTLLLVERASVVPTRVVEQLEMSSCSALLALGLRLRIATATDSKDLEWVVEALAEWRLESPEHERTLAALLGTQPNRVGSRLARMLKRPGALASLLQDRLAPSIRKWRPLSAVGRALEEGKVIWDPDLRLIRTP